MQYRRIGSSLDAVQLNKSVFETVPFRKLTHSPLVVAVIVTAVIAVVVVVHRRKFDSFSAFQ